MPSKPSENLNKLIELVQSNTDDYVVLVTQLFKTNSRWVISLKTKDEVKDIKERIYVICGQKEYTKSQAEKDYRDTKSLVKRINLKNRPEAYKKKLQKQKEERMGVWGPTDVLLSKMREKTAKYRNLAVSMPWYQGMKQDVRWDPKIR